MTLGVSRTPPTSVPAGGPLMSRFSDWFFDSDAACCRIILVYLVKLLGLYDRLQLNKV